jgi:uncharacterized membrane protein YfhO
MYDQGWHAEVGGQPVPIVPHLGSFLGVDLSTGNHRLRLVYRPGEVRIAVAASVGAATVVLAMMLVGARQRAVFAMKGLEGSEPSR